MKKAILMMTFGSPEEITFEGVADFFTNIRRGMRPQDHEIQTLYDNYVRIGGTPLQKITRQEVALVEARLGNEYSVYFANKFSSPFIPDVIGQMEADGIEQCICLILEPHYSFYSVMGYEKFLESKQIQFLVIKDWYQEEALLNYWADEIAKILKEEVKQDSFKVIFGLNQMFWSISENRQNIQTIIFLYLLVSSVSILRSCLTMMWNVMIYVRNLG
ncbi:ferrochelatase [Streptococcus pneumoniae]|nr:ferrochelatase [Streptococcus pneumoniae]COT43918.1 ferrochelatase [Streptococcus pneumoniae]VMT76654.1 ferrochelatase [Streptococcus pneumoniae]VMY32173.1 ferrochelatase [Streptococcus pneumoniae]VND29435.1 ferrochelatase [Streptococcus pneumoniae]